MSTKRLAVITTLLAAALLLAGCDSLPEMPALPTIPPIMLPQQATEGAAPADAAPQAQAAPVDASTSEDPAALTPEPTTAPPAMGAPWPLAADLFVLDAGGKIWRQGAAGEAPVAVTRDTLTIADFALAPGEGWLAYRTADYVAIASADGQEGRIVAEEPPPAGDLPADLSLHSLAWSPDGGALAFTTAEGFQVWQAAAPPDYGPLAYPVADAGAVAVALSWSPGGDWLLIRRADATVALFSADPLQLWAELGEVGDAIWLDDGRLAFTPAAGGLALLTPGDAESRAFFVPQDEVVTQPTQLTDESLAFFVAQGDARVLMDADLLHGNVAPASDMTVEPAGLAWEPDGARLVGPADDADTLTVLDPVSGALGVIDTGAAVTRLAWGDAPDEQAESIPLPANLYYLATQDGTAQAWRLPSEGAPEVLTDAPADVIAFDAAPEQDRLAYISNGIMWLQEGDADPEALTSLSSTANSVAFSPDGDQMVFTNGGLWLHDFTTGGRILLVANRMPSAEQERMVETYSRPQWSPDGAWLFAQVNYYEGHDLVLLNLADTIGSGTAPIPLELFGAAGRWAPSQRTGVDTVYAYSAGSPYSTPFLVAVIPGEEPAIDELATIPVGDVRQRDDDRLAVLRVPAALGGGPSVLEVISMTAAGRDAEAESGPIPLESPALSPDGTLIAGLDDLQIDAGGALAGQLVIVDSASGTRTAISDARSVRELWWGR